MYLPKCTQPLASLVTKPRPTNHTSQCVIGLIPILGQMFYGYGENMLVGIIAYNSKKIIRGKQIKIYEI